MDENALILALTASLAVFAAGLGLGVTLRGKRRTEGLTAEQARSVTRLLMVDTARFAWGWVSTSYLIALYSTVRLGVVYTLEELSKPALSALLLTIVAKVGENIFEHNDGKLFGTSNKKTGSDGAGDL